MQPTQRMSVCERIVEQDSSEEQDISKKEAEIIGNQRKRPSREQKRSKSHMDYICELPDNGFD